MTDPKIPFRDFGSYDLVVVGGGCTGVCAAVRAARLGLRVAIIERGNCLGGVATAGLVNVWHTLFDVDGKEQVIAGLTAEIEEILLREGHAKSENTPSSGIRFDPNAMKWVLDRLVVEHAIRIFFHSFYCGLTRNGDGISDIWVANKDGLGRIKADFFIDATGDGDLCRDVGLPRYRADALQPPSPCYFIRGNIETDLGKLFAEHGAEFGLEDDWGWSGFVPGVEGVSFRADFHIFDRNCDKAEELTAAEIEGRAKIYAFAAMLQKYVDPTLSVVALCSAMGIRETVHYETVFRANEQDLLLGKGYEDTVMRGTYRVDIHHQHDNGITFKYLTGLTETIYGKSERRVFGNWRQESGITGDYAKYYQIPFRILVQQQVPNLIPVGRMLNADPGAFGALRVMVNLNQLGEAAGVAAFMALDQQKPVSELDGKAVQTRLRQGGSR